MAHQVFISFSSRDRESAERIRDRLELAGAACWISSRDVGPGQNYQESIVAALQAAPVFMLVFSPHSNASPEVHKELSLASAYRRVVIPVRIVDLMPTGAMAYELATRQWVDAFAAWDPAMEQLTAAIHRATGGLQPDAAAAPVSAPAAPVAPRAEPSIFSAAELEPVRAALAAYVGPMAEVFVRKAALEARSVADLHKRLAANIPDPSERTAFQQAVKRRF